MRRLARDLALGVERMDFAQDQDIAHAAETAIDERATGAGHLMHDGDGSLSHGRFALGSRVST